VSSCRTRPTAPEPSRKSTRILLGAAALAIAACAADDVTATGAAEAQALESLRLIVPVQGVRRDSVRDTFDERRGGASHEALDIAAPRGTPVLAAADGRVAKLFTSAAGGLTVYVFDPAQRFALYYAHLDGYASGLREGARVARGDVLGYVGTTGNAPPDAPHLHFAIFRLGPEHHWWQGTAIDPYPYLNDR
jgi:murein DD-endopeptidase MepM/ murein hydrolase activator NlpD